MVSKNVANSLKDLKKEQKEKVRKLWSEQEIEDLTYLIKNGITIASVIFDKGIFKGRTQESIEHKVARLKPKLGIK